MSQEVVTTNINQSEPPRKKSLKFIIGLMALIGLTVFFTVEVHKHAEVLRFFLSQSQLKNADCGVVLTGGPGRVREGMTLLSQKYIKKLVISGAYQHVTLSDIFPEILFYPEISLEDVVLERRSSSTAANALQSLPIVEALQCQSVLLVTSDFHMYRAFKVFSQIFPSTVELTPYALTSERFHKRQVWFDLRYWTTVFDEWLKFQLYRVTVFE